MSQSATWDTLQIARDARFEGHDAVAAQLYAEASDDAPEHVRRSHRRTIMPFWFDDGTDEYDEPYEVEPEAVQRAAWRAKALAIDWLAWSDPLKTSSFDAILKEAYPIESVAQMAMRPNAMLSMLRKDSDGIEARVASYANLIVPVAYGVIKVE